MMAFQLDYNGPGLSDYSSAVRAWERAERWRGENGEHDKRKLDGRKRHVSIRKLSGGGIACRLHNTDVVVYNTDNTISIESWSSVSTDTFARSMLPSDLVPTFNSQGCDIWVRPHGGSHHVWAGEWQGWQFDRGHCTFKPSSGDYTYEPVDPKDTAAITEVILDKPAANKARKDYRWNDLKVWYNAFKSLTGGVPKFKMPRHQRSEICALLKAGDYTALFEAGEPKHSIPYWRGSQIPDPLQPIKEAIYHAEDCIHEVEHEFVIGWSRMKQILASRGRW